MYWTRGREYILHFRIQHKAALWHGRQMYALALRWTLFGLEVRR